MSRNECSALLAAYAADQVGGPYIYGATAQRCTIGYRTARAEQYPEYADKIEGCCPALSGEGVGCSGCKWDGRIAHDCAQLVRYAAKAAGLSLPSGATSQWEDGDWAASGLIRDLPQDYICIVYRKRDGRMVHTGVYMGDGTTVEARGHADGVVRGEVGDYPWTHWAILRGMACPDGAGLLQARPVLRKGSKDKEAVKELQRLLRAQGYSLEIDGIFGTMTRQAVMSYQGTHGLARDGVVGEMTWAALTADAADPTRYTVTITGLPEAVARQICKEHGGRMEREGGDDNG